jgi:hypothetical protein
MFEINKEEMAKRKVESEARSMFAKMLMESIMTSETAPEHMKLCVGVLSKIKDIDDVLHKEIISEYCTPGKEANTETLKKVLEYLGLVEIGIKQFLETTPFVAKTEEG